MNQGHYILARFISTQVHRARRDKKIGEQKAVKQTAWFLFPVQKKTGKLINLTIRRDINQFDGFQYFLFQTNQIKYWMLMCRIKAVRKDRRSIHFQNGTTSWEVHSP